jgi:hypothetical protein
LCLLGSGDTARVFDDTLHGIVVNDPELTPVNLQSGTGMGAHKDEVALLAPRAAGEALLVLITVGSHLQDKQDCGEELFMVDGNIGLKDAAIELLVHFGDSAQHTVPRRVRELLGFLFRRFRQYGSIF